MKKGLSILLIMLLIISSLTVVSHAQSTDIADTGAGVNEAELGAETYPKISALKISRVYQSDSASGLCYWCSMATVQGYCLGSYTYGGYTTDYTKAGTDYDFYSQKDAISKYLNTFSGYANSSANLNKYPVKMTLVSSGLGNNTSTYQKIYAQLKLGKPVIVYASGSPYHASVIIGYNGSTTSLDPAGFTLLEVRKNGSYWTNTSAYYTKYANSPQINRSASGSNMSCYVTLKSWLSTNSFTINQLCYPTNYTSVSYNIAYNANGGSGSISSSTVAQNASFTVSANKFSKSGYYFAYYNVQRKSDSAWYTASNGWQKEAAIRDNGYAKKTFAASSSQTMNSAWISGATNGDTFTFYPVWKPNNPTLTFYPNYSGCNYILGGGLDSSYSSYLKSRDTGIYTLFVDSSQRLNNQNSLKIVATSAGSSGHDMEFRTSTNTGQSSGSDGTYDNSGDNRKLTLTFWAKASVSGAKMYFRYGYNTSSAYKSISLTTEWKKYSVDMTKNEWLGSSIHPYLDKAGTFWLNNITLCDGSNGGNNFRYEDGYNTTTQSYTHGGTYSSLPTLSRDGYTFLGWFTQAEGGTQITTSTKVNDFNTKVYAHWEKNISDSAAKTAYLDEKKYELYDNAVTWEQASELCEQKGGHLVTINSQEENDFVYDLIKDTTHFAWLGGKLNDSTMEWEWVTGEAFDYTNWNTGEPNANQTEYYLQMFPMNIGTGSQAGCWNDCNTETSWHSYYSYQNAVYVCEYEVEKPVVIEPDSIELDYSHIDLNVGETFALTATVYPENATNKTVTWLSDDESVATVDENGVVTAIGEGITVIYANTISGEAEARCTVEVTDDSIPSRLTWNGYEYYVTDDGNIGISGYEGEETDLQIPSKIDGKPVTEISGLWFNDSLKSVVIPESVKIIMAYTFQGCTSLQKVTILGAEAIYNDAFSHCESLSDVSLPDTLTSISLNAFVDCKSLKSVTIPKSVTEIKDFAFGYYYELREGEEHVWDSREVEGFTIYGYTNTAAESYANANGFTFISLDNVPTEAATVTPTEGMTEDLTEPPVIPYPIFAILGDANGDETVDAIDATIIQRYSLKIPVAFLYETLMHADVNGDGELDVVDATLIQRYALNIPTRYPIGEPTAA